MLTGVRRRLGRHDASTRGCHTRGRRCGIPPRRRPDVPDPARRDAPLRHRLRHRGPRRRLGRPAGAAHVGRDQPPRRALAAPRRPATRRASGTPSWSRWRATGCSTPSSRPPPTARTWSAGSSTRASSASTPRSASPPEPFRRQRPPMFNALPTVVYAVPDLDLARAWYAGSSASPTSSSRTTSASTSGRTNLGLVPAEAAAGRGGDARLLARRERGRRLRAPRRRRARRRTRRRTASAATCGRRPSLDPFGNLVGIIEYPGFEGSTTVPALN